MDDSLTYRNSVWPISSGLSYMILFIIWPFLALLSALANYGNRYARRVVYIFLVYYGFTFVAEFQYMDAVRYVEDFLWNTQLPFHEFFRIVGGFYTTDTSIDIAEPLVSFIVSRFTKDYHFLFAAYACIFAFFYIKSINLLYERYKERPDRNALVFLIFFVAVIPITNINVARMWIAAWIFFYGAYHVIVYHRGVYLLVALGACLMHWSYISINLILIAYYFAGNRNFIYAPLAILSFLLPNALIPLISLFVPYLGSAVTQRYEGYTSESYTQVVQEASERATWFVPLNNHMIFIYFIVAIVVIRFLRRDYVRGRLEENWYSFLLLLVAFVNFGRPLPAFGSRMQVIFILFATCYVFFYFLNLSWGRWKFLTLLGIIPMLLNTFIEFRIGSESINPWLFAPGLGMPLLDPVSSVAELLFH